jgi:ribosomal protein L14
MLQKFSHTTVSDNSGVAWLQLFHLYRGSWRRYAYIGDFAKGAVKEIAFYPLRVRGKRYRPLRKGFVVRGLVTQTVKERRFLDNTRCQFTTNAVVLLKRRGVFKSKYIYGPLSRLVKRRQYAAYFEAAI